MSVKTAKASATKKSPEKGPKSAVSGIAGHLALLREMERVCSAWLSNSFVRLPLNLSRAVVLKSGLTGVFDEEMIFDLFGDTILGLFDDLGPVYGKAGQTLLTRLPPRLQDAAETLRLTRLYGSWPAMPFAEIEKILDREIPTWRSELEVEATPLGVASTAQVHGARDKQGREWVVKVLKPHAKKRLLESVAALEQLIRLASPVAISKLAKRSLRELQDLCASLRREIDMTIERETILRVHTQFEARNQASILLIPEIHPHLWSKDVLTLQRFRGTPLSMIVAGKAPLTEDLRQKLAKYVLQELLVQVFEMGLFHADPHAGNLILTEEGHVGLFDWGLVGELRDGDRRHIATLLRAAMALDLEMLVDALAQLAADGGKEISRDKIAAELKKIAAKVKKAKASSNTASSGAKGESSNKNKIPVNELLETCLQSAEKLDIPVPDGLLLMAKSLMTIEGLARGVDPDVSMLRVAGPILFRAARPGIKDFISMARRLPQMVQLFRDQPKKNSK